MSLESISTKEIKQRLITIEDYLPSKQRSVPIKAITEFSSLLAQRLFDETNPPEFYAIVRLLMFDLIKGRNSFSGENIENHLLVKQDICFYVFLDKYILEIVSLTCPDYFVKRIKEYYNEE